MSPTAPTRDTIRPVSPADAAAMQAYLAGLGAESRRLRFHGRIDPAAPSLLRRLTGADGVRQLGFVAVRALHDGDVIVGEAQCFLTGEDACAEFAISVADEQRGSGLAGALMAALLAAAAAAGAQSLHGEVLAGNERMAAFMARQGFSLDVGAETEPGVVRFSRGLVPLRPRMVAANPAWWQRLLRRATAPLVA